MLGKRGWRVDLYERRSDPRARGFIGGRSINLALSVRGITALEHAGLSEGVLEDAIAMRGRMMHSRGGELVHQPYSAIPGESINSVSRGGLNLKLLEAADVESNVALHFDHRLRDVELTDDDRAIAIFDTPNGEVRAEPDLIIGADGAFSGVRGRLQRTERFSFSQSYLEHGYKELTIPPNANGDFAVDPHALHIWPRGGSMMIALPNPDRSFTCTLFWPLEGDHSFAALPDDAPDEQILAFFGREYGDAVPLMPTLLQDYRTNPTSSLVTIRCNPWHWSSRVVLIGDASHAIVPFYGQGMNAAFEDCRIFDELVDKHGADFATLLPEFSRLRKPHADAIADMALTNFVEMRDKVGSKMFLLRKKLEKLLHRVFPKQFLPLYNMVSFSNIPYADAREDARRQDVVLFRAAAVLAALLLGLAIGIVYSILK